MSARAINSINYWLAKQAEPISPSNTPLMLKMLFADQLSACPSIDRKSSWNC
jgi:hypothetical protein